MATPKRAINPFYVLLVIVGVAFLITACAYGVMTIKQMRVEGSDADNGSSASFVQFVDEHGFALLMWEIALLALATVAAIATDEFWSRRR